MDDEDRNMLDTCERLTVRMTPRERSVIARLNRGNSVTRAEDIEIREIWDRVTFNGQDLG